MGNAWQSEGRQINMAAQGTDKEMDKYEAGTANSISTNMITDLIVSHSHNSVF